MADLPRSSARFILPVASSIPSRLPDIRHPYRPALLVESLARSRRSRPSDAAMVAAARLLRTSHRIGMLWVPASSFEGRVELWSLSTGRMPVARTSLKWHGVGASGWAAHRRDTHFTEVARWGASGKGGFEGVVGSLSGSGAHGPFLCCEPPHHSAGRPTINRG